jgi:hypothetical protein
MQGQHQATTDLVAQLAVGLYPVPGLTEFFGEPAPTRPRVLCDQLTNEIDIGLTNQPMSITEDGPHAR